MSDDDQIETRDVIEETVNDEPVQADAVIDTFITCVRVSFGQKISVRWDESARARHAKWQVTWTNQTVSHL